MEKFIFLYNAVVGLHAVPSGACNTHNAACSAQSVHCVPGCYRDNLFINVNKQVQKTYFYAKKRFFGYYFVPLRA